MISIREEYELANMVNWDTGDLLGLVPEEFGIWVPPGPGLYPGSNLLVKQVVFSQGNITFLVPKDYVIGQSVAGGSQSLSEIGWTQKIDISNVLDEFLELAEQKPESEIDKNLYLNFAKRWGPLWERVKVYSEEELAVYEGYARAPWEESLLTWWLRAHEVKRILDIAAYLNQDKLAPLELWQLYWPDIVDQHTTLSEQKHWLSLIVNAKGYNTAKISINWSEKEPKLHLHSRRGFIFAVWFQLMQAVSRQQVCICDSCARVYIREGRKPPKGRNNYCLECREDNYKAAKKSWSYKSNKTD